MWGLGIRFEGGVRCWVLGLGCWLGRGGSEDAQANDCIHFEGMLYDRPKS